MRSPLRALLAAAVLGGSWSWCAAARSADVERRAGRWEFFAPNVTGALVGRAGKCFYTTRGERASKLTVSADGLVAPGFTPLLFDRAGRLWCLQRGADTIHGLKGDSLITLKPPKGASYEAAGATRPFVSAYEDSAGRLWFGNSRGVQWFDGKEWASKVLADPKGIELSRLMTPVVFAEDDKGRLFFSAQKWGRGTCGTQGVWSFDGKAWAHFTAQDLLPSNEVLAVCPASGGVVLVNTPGRLVTLDVRPSDVGGDVARLVGLLNDKQWRVREQATAGLKKLGRRAALDLKRHLTQTAHPEVRSRIKIVLDALTSPARKQQPLPGGRYTCEFIRVRPQRRRRRPTGRPQWLAVALNVVDAKTGKTVERATLLLTNNSTRLIDDWPVQDNAHLTSALPDGQGGLWIGVADRGLFHWNGKKTARISTIRTRSFWILLGRDPAGRVLLSGGSRVAAYRPGPPDGR